MAKQDTEKPKSGPQLQLFFVRYYYLIAAALAVGVIAAGYFMFLEPKYISIGIGASNDTTFLKDEQAKRQKYLVQLKDVSKKYRSINQTELTRFKAILPTEPDLPDLYAQFQTLTLKHNLLLGGIAFSEVGDQTAAEGEAKTGNGKLKKLSVSINVAGQGQGSYEEMKSFLTTLEDNLRLFDIQSVFFTPGSSAYAINLYTYYLSQ
jgi:hypothetical protein